MMQVGTMLVNRYRLDAQLGEGGMGVVYRAHDTMLDRPVAIKTLSPGLHGEDALKRLLREAQSAAGLAHPGIVATYDVLDDAGGRHIVMELVDGKTLRALAPLPWREAVGLMLQVFEAVEFAHSRGIIHRDLKPENIMVTSDGRARVMDFGLARSEGRSRLTQTGLVVGTTAYMAPEQALRGNTEARSDLYALGCVFYEVLTGRPPFQGEDALSVITQHINLPPTPPRRLVPDIPPALEALILKLLAKDPSERPAAAADVASVLALMTSAPQTRSAEGTAALDALAPGPADRVRRVRLVGRSEPLRRLQQHLDAGVLGRGALVAVSGEPGIGKTRVIEEVIASARVRDFVVLTARCHERDVAIPYTPISDALQSFARTCAPALWKELLQAAGPEVNAFLSDSLMKHLNISSVLAADSGAALSVRVAAEVRPARAFRNILARLSSDGPVLFAIDDLHWADPPTLDLIHHLALSTRETPLLILGTYREVELERSHPLSRLLVDLNRERLLVRERLRRLSLAETSDLIEALLGGPAPEGLAALAHEQTEGNPFFLEEVINGLIDGERLRWDSDASAYHLAPGVTIERLAGEVPQGVRAAIGERLDHLEAGAQQILSLASVIGRYFAVDLLTRLAGAHGLTDDEVEAALSQAGAARFVSPVEDGTQGTPEREVTGFTAGSASPEADYAFDHPLIHQVVYGELDRRRRRRLHAELGYILEDIYRGLTDFHAERLAYHFLESDEDAKAVEYSRRAGDKALRAYYDPNIALNYYLPALEMVLAKDPALKRLAQRSPVPLTRSAVHQFSPEERASVVGYLEEVLRSVRGSPPAKAVAQLASRIAVAAMHLGPVFEASVRLYEETLLGPDAQKLVVATPHGNVVGILEFPGPGGPYPVVLLFHGSGGGKETVSDEAERYRQRGMATLRVDLPGFGETTVQVTATLRDVEVLKEMITTVLARERVDGRGVGIAAWSLGPWHAAQLAARDARVRAVVSISGMFNPLDDTHPGTEVPEPIWRARIEAAYRAGKRASPSPLQWAPDTNTYDVADQIRCPMLLVYGVLEPEMYRVQAEELAALVPTAVAQPWRSGVHVLRNVPEALEGAAEWMKQQLAPPPRQD
ncbi:MAG TPA: alpha/beta fold hydrolase [bacterium]